ncbi:3-dehydroquinate synthase [Sandarakinorhabdus rubra]|uniref:3-dehydroquinate synthase n=1 Tax=Sandarakinorhabdus rubra TaxID=2672568 RepID=UPI0013D9FA09|nr:3-dehydroquinate synthase [Sandarakinorhabdus rubra]
MIIDVALGARAYPIHIRPGLLGEAGALLSPFARGGRLALVTDEIVAGLHLEALRAALGDIAIEAIILPPGEATKDWRHLELVTERLLALGIERRDAVLALGGGVIGDLTGFACAILKRGCRFVQIPTTLLSQVDSSVGGKTAINAAAGKNLVGAFHQPAAVLIDPAVLATLPRRELMAGYAEVVKYGLLGDAEFFGWCERHGAEVLAGDAHAQVHAIAHSCRAKAGIVAADERETDDIRALLNLGHTFGHAFEAETGFSDRLLHGEAVALGMVLAFRLSARLGLCTAEDAGRVAAHLSALGFTVEAAALGLDCPAARLVEHMLHDKKMSGGRLPFILAHGIGQAFVARDVDLAEVERFLAGQLAA